MFEWLPNAPLGDVLTSYQVLHDFISIMALVGFGPMVYIDLSRALYFYRERPEQDTDLWQTLMFEKRLVGYFGDWRTYFDGYIFEAFVSAVACAVFFVAGIYVLLVAVVLLAVGALITPFFLLEVLILTISEKNSEDEAGAIE